MGVACWNCSVNCCSDILSSDHTVCSDRSICDYLMYEYSGVQYRWFFMGRGFTSGGQESGSVFSTVTGTCVCKVQASKCPYH